MSTDERTPRRGEDAQTLAERRRYQRDVRASLDDEDQAELDRLYSCPGCGCSDTLACPDGCNWADSGLCTACAREGVTA